MESFVYDAIRTPFGRMSGALADVRPDDLAATVIRACVDRAQGLDPAQIDGVWMGNANGSGEENRNVARMATLLAGLPVSIPGGTVNRLCGSSLDAAMVASREIEVGEADLLLVGGVESMSRAPWVLPKPEKAYPKGNLLMESTALGWRQVNPRMPKEWTVSLGEATEQLRQKEGISRERQDEFALRSHRLAAAAWDAGEYADHVVAVEGSDLTRDESIRADATMESLGNLRTSFRPVSDDARGGTITAGNASPMSDGASAVWLGSVKAQERLGLAPLARIAGRGAHAVEPQFFGIGPVEAANLALKRAGITWGDVGAVELNEAFAAQSLACLDAWEVDPEIVNTWGGAIAIGHPLGASGARVLGTLTHRLRRSGARWGLATACIGVGQGLAVVLENTASTHS